MGRRVASQYRGPDRRILRDVDGPNATQTGDVAGANAGVCVTRSGHRNVESWSKFRLVVDPCDPMSVSLIVALHWYTVDEDGKLEDLTTDDDGRAWRRSTRVALIRSRQARDGRS